jgi:Chaperone of endosialidase
LATPPARIIRPQECSLFFDNTTGGSNTATGFAALGNNITGANNTAIGYLALFNNTTAFGNTATGYRPLTSNTNGADNTAIGSAALFNNTNGDSNRALAVSAGFGVTTASSVICIGASGANVNNSTWIGNVYGVTTQSGATAPVVVSNGGQLGTVTSSERFKKDITNMAKASEIIFSLRPITFHYKSDAIETPQFGLVAEEVVKVDPSLVLPDKEGKPYTVRYDAVNAMLLDEFLKEHRKVDEQDRKLEEQGTLIAKQEQQIETLAAG